MRAFAIGLLVITFSAFGIFVWFLSNVRWTPYGESTEPIATTPSGPRPELLQVTVASAHGWDVVTRGQQVTSEVRHDTGTCADPFNAMDVVPHAGRTRVTLEVRPQPAQQLVINAVRVRVNVAVPLTQSPTYLYHCAAPAGPAGEPATRVLVEPRTDAVHRISGAFPLQVPADGYRQDIEVEVHGEKAADWQVEVDYTLDGVTRTQPADSPRGRGLVTEPQRGDATGHWVWCDRSWRAGERC